MKAPAGMFDILETFGCYIKSENLQCVCVCVWQVYRCVFESAYVFQSAENTSVISRIIGTHQESG